MAYKSAKSQRDEAWLNHHPLRTFARDQTPRFKSAIGSDKPILQTPAWLSLSKPFLSYDVEERREGFDKLNQAWFWRARTFMIAIRALFDFSTRVALPIRGPAIAPAARQGQRLEVREPILIGRCG
jgi:hypothetical protein